MVKISWEAPEFDYHEKSTRWLWISMLGALFFLAFAVWQKNFLFGFFIIAAEVLVLTWGVQKPRRLAFTLDEHGLSIDNHRAFYPLKDLESFSVDSIVIGGHRAFAVHFHQRWRMSVRFRVPDIHAEEIRSAFGAFLIENPWEETLVDSLERFLRF